MQHKKPNKLDITFRLKDVVIPKYSFIAPRISEPLTPDHQYTIEVNSGVLIEKGRKEIIIILHIKIFYDKEKEILISDLGTNTIYEIENFDKVIKKKNKNEYQAPDQLVITLLSIALSTTRGIMIEKNSDNFLHKVFIPVVSPKDLLAKKKKQNS